MNCPNCGAENEVGARFCVECGAPLETQLNLPDRPPEADDDSDRTILSSTSRIAEEAQTMAVTQDQLAAEAEVSSSFNRPPEPEPIPMPPPVGPSSSSSGGSSQGFMTQRNIIIAVIVIVLLCSCCCILGAIASVLSNEDLMRELSLIPLSLLMV